MKTARHITIITLALLVTACSEQPGQSPSPSSGDGHKQPALQTPIEDREPAEAAVAITRLEERVIHPPGPAAKRLHSSRKHNLTAADMQLSGLAGNAVVTHYAQPRVDRENYLHYQQNGVKRVAEQPLSTFSVDVDTAGYANVRRMLVREGRLPPADAVGLEEMINYFSYSYANPEFSGAPFSINTQLAPAPWSEHHQLLQIGLQGFAPSAERRPPANLVFLFDVSGSTHGSAGIELAYALAAQHRIEGGINRVIIASDGDMNVATVNIESLKNLVERKRKDGIALTTLGFGSGSYNYALMEQLAEVGNGNAAYIDSLNDAQKVLVNEMQSTLLTIAADVKIQVEFNPALVSAYRLIGYENRTLRREDFSNDKVDAGEIGAGHTVTALYKIVLTGSGGVPAPALRYGTQSEQHYGDTNELAFIKLRYK